MLIACSNLIYVNLDKFVLYFIFIVCYFNLSLDIHTAAIRIRPIEDQMEFGFSILYRMEFRLTQKYIILNGIH